MRTLVKLPEIFLAGNRQFVKYSFFNLIFDGVIAFLALHLVFKVNFYAVPSAEMRKKNDFSNSLT